MANPTYEELMAQQPKPAIPSYEELMAGAAPAAAHFESEAPDLGAPLTGVLHANKWLASGLGDKIQAAALAGMEGLSDKTGKSFGDRYNQNLSFLDAAQTKSDALHPAARWIGNTVGVAVNLAAAPLLAEGLGLGVAENAVPALVENTPKFLKLAQSGWQAFKPGALFGGLAAFGEDRSKTGWDTAKNVAANAAMSGVLAGALPLATAIPGVSPLSEAVSSVPKRLSNALEGFANKRAVKATLPMLRDYRAMSPERVQDMGQTLLKNKIVTAGATPETILERANAFRENQGKAIGNFLDDLSGMQSVREQTAPIQAAIHGEVPVERQINTGWTPVEETQRVHYGNADPFYMDPPRYAGQDLEPPKLVEHGVFEHKVARPEFHYKTVTEMEPATVGYEPRDVTHRYITDRFEKAPLVSRLQKELPAEYSGMGYEGLGGTVKRLISSAEKMEGASGRPTFAEANAAKSRLQKSINYANPGENTLNAVKRDAARILNSEIERQGEAMLTANNAPPEAMQNWLQNKKLYGHADSAVTTLEDALKRREANRFLSASDHAFGLSGLVAAAASGHPLYGPLLAGVGALGNKVIRERGSATAAAGADLLANILRAGGQKVGTALPAESGGMLAAPLSQLLKHEAAGLSLVPEWADESAQPNPYTIAALRRARP